MTEINKIVMISAVIVTFLSTVVISYPIQAGSEIIQEQIIIKIEEQNIRTDQLNDRLKNIQELIKPIVIPNGVRVKKK